MESLSRPPHRRKHSTGNAFSSSFSFKKPYDDVVLANGGERKSLEAHEYTEIFSGSSSIPVLDFPGLDDRVGPVNSRNAELDYSSIFGGFRNDDVFVPYEELLNGSAKKTKPRIPAEARPHESGSLHSSRKTKRPSGEASDQSVDVFPQESGSLHSSRKTKKPSGEASDQSVGGVKQKLNISSDRTKQKNSEAPHGETHTAQAPAFPGFTHFADGTPWLDKTKGENLPSLKREVSRTWSFSAEVGPVNNKGGSSREPSQMHDKSLKMNEVNLKSQFSKVPSLSSGNKDPGQSRVPNFPSKDGVSRKTAGECSPPLFGEEFDENSVDAESAAALKKAIEQAQESIRIAKMIMERKRESYREAYGSKYNNAKGKHDDLDHIFNELAGINSKFSTPRSDTDTTVNAANSEVERTCENVEADIEQGEAFERKSKLCTQGDRFHNDDRVKVEKLEKKVEAAETHRDRKDHPGLVTNKVCGTVGLETEKIGNSNSLTPSLCKVPSNLGEIETGKGIFEQRKVTIHHTEVSEAVPEVVEKPSDSCQRRQKLEKGVEEDELCHAKGHESVVERALDTSEMTEGMEKSVDSNDKEEHDEMLIVENLMLRSEFNNVLDESCNRIKNESLEQEKTEKISENVAGWKENDQHEKCFGEEFRGLRPEEANLWFESNEQLTEALLEINKKEPKIATEVGEVEKKVDDGHESEIDDKKQDCTGDADKPKLTDELMYNKVEEKRANTSEYEARGTVLMEPNHCAEDQVRGNFCDAEETDNTHEGEVRSEGDHNKYEFQKAAYEEDVGEAFELSSSDASTIFDEAHTNDTSTIFDEAHTNDTSTMSTETLEACSVDSNNKAEEHWKAVENLEENDTFPEVKKTISGIVKDKKAELFFHPRENEILGTNSLHRSASEEIFVENKMHVAFEDLSSYSKMETVGVMDADPEENLPKDEDVSNTTGEVHEASQEYVVKINRETLPEDLASDIRTAEFNFTDVRQALEQESECDEVSVSASSSERIDGLSANESEECAENVMDRTSDKEELKDDLEMISDEREHVEELIEGLSQSHSEPKEMDKFKDRVRAEGGGLNMEDNKENSTEEREAKESVQHSDSNDQQQRIEAIKRGREREKDRIAVERAIREARERAFAEARERAERAAVERATAEARQRVMAEAKEKVEKANVVKRSVDKASTEAKLRAERAAVERATAEARGRALEKAMSLKVSTESDRNPTERVSSSSRNNVLKHSFSSSDLESGTNTESAQRRKARLERHQRIMERAAKALAEKNMRDLLAQKEQAERNRLAESLDADIKRWATGKEGNLRALLSTLQYILGTDSGWQPISLTEIITTAAVKKAYRKATLYVHPDKLQQRGASVQQKYICEKVFDLLKAAWNRFNSDER